MNDVSTVEQLERVLRTADLEPLGPARLAEIRTRGRRRRRIRLVGVAIGAAAAMVAASVGVAAVTGTIGDQAQDDPPVAHETPHELSALARRVLAEIPGAVQVSSWQVVIPRPGGARDLYGAERVPSANVAAGPVDVGARWYAGVTTFRKQDFPAWLYDGVADYEEHVLGDGEGHPIGSTDIGVIVDAGPMRLACMRPLAHWSDSDPTPGCFPAMLSGEDGNLEYQWGMGTDDFLQPGADLELFSIKTYTSGSADTVWIGGADGTEVATVDLVTTDGETVSATVAADSFVPGETMFWGVVDGELAKAVSRDAEGNVLEDHEVKPCSDPVDCEVR